MYYSSQSIRTSQKPTNLSLRAPGEISRCPIHHATQHPNSTESKQVLLSTTQARRPSQSLPVYQIHSISSTPTPTAPTTVINDPPLPFATCTLPALSYSPFSPTGCKGLVGFGGFVSQSSAKYAVREP
ncbi:hypothetical protein K458DRAFT_49070 [Lentithecium fluviatile CBS 122367]|uniref:Uncharacterized protein n=1 Tax=Lentithecium fluviatile CBS 122367 TaxID=1168545 RepID=A0A6G1IXX7_9PLEO|nr:hypothetical protein K458DRAFT_49070 [Lentithecium fluviatile CBS 122367]